MQFSLQSRKEKFRSVLSLDQECGFDLEMLQVFRLFDLEAFYLLLTHRLDQFSDVAFAMRTKRILLEQELFFVLDIFLKNEIRFLVFKGMHLGYEYYPQPELRPMGDIDLLVQKSDYEKAQKILLQNGYVQTEKNYKHSFRLAYTRVGCGVSIDLHFKPLVDDSESIVSLYWSRARNLKILGNDFLVLHPVDALMVSLRHSCIQHVLESPLWLTDLHLLILVQSKNKQECDHFWDEFMNSIDFFSTDSRFAFYLILSILKKQFLTPIPDHVLEGLKFSGGYLQRKYFHKILELDFWFSLEGLSELSSLMRLRNRYFLRGNFFNAAKFFIARSKRKMSEKINDLF